MSDSQKFKQILEDLSQEVGHLQDVGEAYQKLQHLTETYDAIANQFKEIYKDFESTVRIKLDENKSQIRQLIESERDQIKQIFSDEFDRNTKELKRVMEVETLNQTQLLAKKCKTISILLWFFGGLAIILSASSLWKLWAM